MQMHQTSGRWRTGLALSLLTVLLWGVLPLALTITLQALDVYTVTWYRFAISFGVLGIFLARRNKLPKLGKLRSILGLIAIATIFLATNYLLFLQGLAQTSPANAEVVIQVAPVLFAIGAITIFKERFTRRQWLGMSVLVLGFVLFFHEQLRTLITAPTKYIIGSSLLILAAATWSIYALAQKQLLQTLSSTSIMLIIYGGCTLLFIPVAAPAKVFTLSPLHLGMLIFCGLNTLIAYGAFAESLEHWEASKVSAVLALAPIVTLIAVKVTSFLFPNLIASERLTILAVIGAFLVVAGSMAIALGKNRSH